MGNLDGQVAIVTGCGRMRGSGRGIALALAQAGATLAVNDVVAGGTRNAGERMTDGKDGDAEAGWRGISSLVEELEQGGTKAMGIIGDVGLKADAERMIKEVINRFGRIDILVNNAAAPHGEDRKWLWEVPEESFDIVMRINAKGVFLMSTAVIRHMLDRGGPGRIINIAAGSGKIGNPKRGPYSASKFAIRGLTQVMAAELAPRGITVNAICPGVLDTARHVSTMANARAGNEVVNMAAGGNTNSPDATTPVGRVGLPSDIANAVVFLADPASNFITGQSLGVDGGRTMS